MLEIVLGHTRLTIEIRMMSVVLQTSNYQNGSGLVRIVLVCPQSHGSEYSMIYKAKVGPEFMVFLLKGVKITNIFQQEKKAEDITINKEVFGTK